ncbi:lipoyl(octanoyl) transferase LipB [Flocculibacter collagenilyticus]|uniref:lipoyl(octanoyl) transferase LipB n=1 Tax=Flocculibacter collagenilyticus TaxID=2744479 RepID=UPI0018F7B84D|nr:lipoyl(octanoyl) transferase LipB [Flocculibacter collagenilyticus]
MLITNRLVVRELGQQDYEPVWHAMQHFTDNRGDETVDEIWLVEHNPIFTQGQAGKEEHLLATGDIPVIKVDRGGQVTYHGPGQLVIYFLLDLKRNKLGIRQLVTHIEQAIIEMLQAYNINAEAKSDAPGVYVNNNKIASLGLRVRKGCTFHGLALNVDMDLAPFLRINPCGYAGMQMVQCKELSGPETVQDAQQQLVKTIADQLNKTELINTTGLIEQND